MKIIDNTTPDTYVFVDNLKAGTIYRMYKNCSEIFMVVQSNQNGFTTRIKHSVSLTTGRIIPWEGHERQRCEILNATLEVSN